LFSLDVSVSIARELGMPEDDLCHTTRLTDYARMLNLIPN